MIIVVEPQCIGFEHAEVNSALLVVILKAFPDKKLCFFAESKHLDTVKNLIKTNCENFSMLECLAIDVPDRKLPDISRVRLEWALAKSVFHYSIKLKCNRVIFASITSAGLWCIKVLIQRFSSILVTIIPHGILETIFRRPPLRPWAFPFWFRFCFLFQNVERVKFLLFGESNRSELVRAFPKMKPFVDAIDLPYFFPKENVKDEKRQSCPIRFASLGVAHTNKGSKMFFDLASDVRRKIGAEKVEFHLIGHITDEKIRKHTSDEVIIASKSQPLSRELFDDLASKIDFAIFCFSPLNYRLTVSGSFFDALAYAKPIIALKTPFFDYYFGRMGDIGYLCDGYEELVSLTKAIASDFPLTRYAQQVTNIKKGRSIFEPDYLAPKLLNIFDPTNPIDDQNSRT